MTRSIALIDRSIAGIRRILCSRHAVDQMSAASWQAAWDAEPKLAAKHAALFLERGQAQLVRDARRRAAA